MPFDGTQVNETAAHLMRAKRYLEEHGWCPVGSRDGEGRVCMIEALSDVDHRGRTRLTLVRSRLYAASAKPLARTMDFI